MKIVTARVNDVTNQRAVGTLL